ncbi:putative ribonuclease H-like domain-containing protein [Tanacetum coccineum]
MRKKGYANSTNRDSTVSPSVSTARQSLTNADDLPIDPLMSDLEDTSIFSSTYDDEDVGAEADLNNLETTKNVSPIPTTRIHKDHSKGQIIGDINSATQTRRMTKISKKHAMVSYIKKQRRTNHKDYQNCLFTCFLSQIEPKKVAQALTDPSWTKAMQDELLQFRLQKVWRLVDLPKGKHAIRTKWVYRNKKDERGIVVRNKARLVAQGYTQKEGIDYDEVFALEVYVCQPPCFEDPQFPNKVYKIKKALYGLHQALRAWYETLSTYLSGNRFRRGTIDKTLFIKKDKGDILLVQVYVDDIIFGSTKNSLCVEFEHMMHKKFQMSSMGELTFFLGLQTTSTPIETNKALLKDKEAEVVDVHLYRSMIRSLMYLTASRPDITFAVCAYARFQVTPKVSHLHAVKRILIYLKGQPKLRLWYPRDSPFDLEAFFDSDYARLSLDRKSTTRDETIYKEWEDIMEKAATTASSLEAEQDSGNINRTHSMATLNESLPQGTDSAAANTLDSGEVQITDINNEKLSLDSKEVQITNTIDGKSKLVSKAFIKRPLKLKDSDGITTLPNIEIFEQLTLMGTYIALTLTQKLFSNMRRASKGYIRVDIPLFLTMLVQGLIPQGEGSTVQETEVPHPSYPTYTNVADEAAFTSVDVVHGGAATTVSSIDAG